MYAGIEQRNNVASYYGVGNGHSKAYPPDSSVPQVYPKFTKVNNSNSKSSGLINPQIHFNNLRAWQTNRQKWMPNNVGVKSFVLTTRAPVYRVCLIDLTWKTTIHSCQRCPRAALTTGAATAAIATQADFEGATSRFCPAGVHMGQCQPISVILANSQILDSKVSGKPTEIPALVNGDAGPKMVPLWVPPELPIPKTVHSRASFSPTLSHFSMPLSPVIESSPDLGKPGTFVDKSSVEELMKRKQQDSHITQSEPPNEPKEFIVTREKSEDEPDISTSSSVSISEIKEEVSVDAYREFERGFVNISSDTEKLDSVNKDTYEISVNIESKFATDERGESLQNINENVILNSTVPKAYDIELENNLPTVSNIKDPSESTFDNTSDVDDVLEFDSPKTFDTNLRETELNREGDSDARTGKKSPATPSRPISAKSDIPTFYVPLGRSGKSPTQIATELDRIRDEVMSALSQLDSSLSEDDGNLIPREQSIPYSKFGIVTKACGCPLYWKRGLFLACREQSDESPVSLEDILTTWRRVLESCTDYAARFVYILTKGKSQFLEPDDFRGIVQDIVETHNSLSFLQSARDFHSRYVTTIIARIFFSVNSSWSGRISLGELRRSNFLSVLASLETADDINLVTQYFSYEHFYVIYCKFWELDTDHDLIISKSDLSRHSEYALSSLIIDRIFSGAVTRGSSLKDGTMTYSEFVWFLLAEEDKRHPRSIEYWFRCMDLDGDGLLSLFELEYFYKEQMARMDDLGLASPSLEDCLCQCLDMVKPVLVDKIRLSDLKRCNMCAVFFNTFFNLKKYLQYEQRDPFESINDVDGDIASMSDWDRYASDAYELLVASENGNQETNGVAGFDEDEALEDDDLSENDCGLERIGSPENAVELEHENFDCLTNDAELDLFVPENEGQVQSN